MPEHERPSDPLRRFSSLGRPLDPAWPTNRAVLVLIPIGALVAAVAAPAVSGLAGIGAIWAGVLGGATVLGTWALGRELAPDDQRAAFVALVLGYGALLFVPGTSLVLLFTTLLLTRMVARTVGLPPKVLDSLGVLLLAGVAVAQTRSLGVGWVTAAAFALDAQLTGGERKQWGFSALALVLGGVLAGGAGLQDRVVSEGVPPALPPIPLLVAAAVVTGLFFVAIARVGAVRARGDATDVPLEGSRVRGGMVIALLIGLQSLVFGPPGAASGALVWAGLTGVALSAIAPPGSRPDGA